MDSKAALDVAERTQGMWEKGWQSGTAAILLVSCALLLALLLRSIHLRVTDAKEERHKAEAILREVSAVVAENAKALFLFQRAIEELGARRQRKAPERKAGP